MERLLVQQHCLLSRNSFIMQDRVGHIEDVVVSKEFEGRGIGIKLVTSLLEIANTRNCYKTILDCKDELIPFYERIGFKQESNQMRYNHY